MCRNYILKNLHNPNCSLESILQKYKKFQVHEINQGRNEFGEYATLFPLLKKDENRFKQYTRLKIKTFYYVLDDVFDCLQKDWCNLHAQAIYAQQALVITLRFLASGLSYRDLAFSFRVGVSTAHGIIKRTLTCTWDKLQPLHMPVPRKNDFVNIAKQFYTRWNFPNCLGAIDVRHIQIKKPKKSGSRFFNYKKFFSIAFQALVGPDYKYISIDVGGFGRQHDSTTFFASQLYTALRKKLLDLLKDILIPNSTLRLPFFFVGDGAYPLMKHLMKPYPGANLNSEQEALNKRLSRARMVSECAFGQTCQKFQILYKTLQCQPKMAELIAKGTAILHNVIIDLEGNRGLSKANLKASRRALHRIRSEQPVNEDHFPRGDGGRVREWLKDFVKENPLAK